MIEKTVLDFLAAEFEDIPVYMEVPENIPEKCIVLEMLGGGESNLVFSASIAAQAYGATLYEAAALNEEVIGAMYNFPSVENIGRCKLASSYNFTDTATKRYRYQSVFDIYYVKED